MMDIANKIKEIIVESCDIDNGIDLWKDNDDLTKLDINSINFIKIVVALESEFGFEFADEDLEFKKFTTVYDLRKYVESKIDNA